MEEWISCEKIMSFKINYCKLPAQIYAYAKTWFSLEIYVLLTDILSFLFSFHNIE